MGLLRLVSALALAWFAVPGTALAQGAAKIIYCCDDTRGRPVCGDILPPVCYGQAYREISPQGTVRRHVAAPLTAEEIARRDAEEQLRQEQEAQAFVQRRLDEALLETYAGLADIDVREERALADVERTVADLRVREMELAEQRARYDREKEFYAGRDLPRDVVVGLRMIDAELDTYRGAIEAKELEKEAIRARYATDRRRYAELIAAGQGRRR